MSFIRRHSVLFFLPAIIQDVHCLQLLSTMRKEALPELWHIPSCLCSISDEQTRTEQEVGESLFWQAGCKWQCRTER